jgi:hypothetical protein
MTSCYRTDAMRIDTPGVFESAGADLWPGDGSDNCGKSILESAFVQLFPKIIRQRLPFQR